MRENEKQLKGRIKRVNAPLRSPTYDEIALKRDRKNQKIRVKQRLRKAQEQFKGPESEQTFLVLQKGDLNEK
ncbi:MAG: hypothetical protein OEY22_01680 [Candidatus Bathyarchaeota archaeon]|nr:hypothetical protein [Candidatus Bathyarchaeota archaeon]